MENCLKIGCISEQRKTWLTVNTNQPVLLHLQRLTRSSAETIFLVFWRNFPLTWTPINEQLHSNKILTAAFGQFLRTASFESSLSGVSLSQNALSSQKQNMWNRIRDLLLIKWSFRFPSFTDEQQNWKKHQVERILLISTPHPERSAVVILRKKPGSEIGMKPILFESLPDGVLQNVSFLLLLPEKNTKKQEVLTRRGSNPRVSACQPTTLSTQLSSHCAAVGWNSIAVCQKVSVPEDKNFWRAVAPF